MENNQNQPTKKSRRQQRLTPTHKVGTLGAFGAIYTIIISIIWCCTVIGMAWGIPTLIICLRYYRTGNQQTKLVAGILGVFFGTIIGGIFIILSDDIPLTPNDVKANLDMNNKNYTDNN